MTVEVDVPPLGQQQVGQHGPENKTRRYHGERPPLERMARMLRRAQMGLVHAGSLFKPTEPKRVAVMVSVPTCGRSLCRRRSTSQCALQKKRRLTRNSAP